MKTLSAIVLLAVIAIAAAAPAVQTDKEKVEKYANDVLTYAKNILAVFPASSPEAAEIKKIIEHVEFRIKEIKSQQNDKLSNIVDTIAYLVLDNEKVALLARRVFAPKQDDKMKLLTFAKKLVEYGNDLVKDFPSTVEATEAKKLIADIEHRIKSIESKLEVSNIVDTVASMALVGEQLFNLDQRLRSPDQTQDDKIKVLTYAKNVLKAAETLEKKYPAEKKNIDAIIKSVHFRIEIVQSQVYLSNLIDTVAYLVLDNEKLAQIAKKHGDHIFN